MSTASHRLLVLSNPAPGKEREYNAWYEEHMDLVLTVPGIDAAQRFRFSDDQFPADLIPPSDHRFLAIYEVSADPAAVIEALMAPEMADVPEVFDRASERAWWYTAIGDIAGAPQENPATKLAVFSNPASLELDGELNQWYDNHLADVLAIGAGAVSAQRFRLSDQQFPAEATPPSSHRYLALYDTAVPEAQTCDTLAAAMVQHEHPRALDGGSLRDWMYTAVSPRRT